MEILVIHTGGTIGSKSENGILSPDSSSPLIAEFLKNDSDYHFTEDFFCSILSENADDHFYEKLINHILALDISTFDGILIMHGTDTLSYSASIISMALRHIDIPVCFVSANYIISDKRSNALENFKMALGYITCGGKGFVVPYKNSNGRRLFHLATRIIEAESITDNFESLAGTPIAEIVNNYFVSFEDKTKVSNEDLSKPKSRIITDKIELKNKILLIKGYPGLDYSVFDIEKLKPSAILHTAYHSGTATTNTLPEFIKKCTSSGIDFYLSPLKHSNELYETTKKLLSCGALPLYNMTNESAIAKLKLKYNLPNININQNLYYEEISGGLL